MDSENKPFLKWFGYSRRERRSTYILLIILILVIALRYLIPPKEIEIENLSGLLASADTGEKSILSSPSDTSRLFNFDPNLASYDTLIILGLSEKQAGTIISYRNKGGRFRQPSDIKKIYGIDEKTAGLIIPFIDIKTDTGREVYFNTGSALFQEKPEKVDLNKTDSTQLEKLPGLGPVLSARIIKFRKLLGGFVSAEQLREVYGLTEETYKLIATKVFTDSTGIKGIYINSAGFSELTRHPYLERYEIQSILKYRELKGKIVNISELVENKILTADKAKKISPYFKF